MANTCRYKTIVKGKKNACYAFFGSMPVLEDKSIIVETGTEDEYEIRFVGECKWAVDAYCESWKGDYPVDLPENSEIAYEEAMNRYMGYTLLERSKMFNVEVLCCSADIEDTRIDHYEHYKNGIMIDDECPDELVIFKKQRKGFVVCTYCLKEFPENEITYVRGDTPFCSECIKKLIYI